MHIFLFILIDIMLLRPIGSILFASPLASSLRSGFSNNRSMQRCSGLVLFSTKSTTLTATNSGGNNDGNGEDDKNVKCSSNGGRISVKSATTQTLSSPTDISRNLDIFLSHFKARRSNDDGETEAMRNVKKLAEMNDERVSMITRKNDLLSSKKKLSKEIGMLMRGADGEDSERENKASEMKLEVTSIDDELATIASTLDGLQETITNLQLSLPNLLHDSVPDGRDESDNIILSESTFPPPVTLPKEPKWHDDIAGNLLGWEAERAVKMSGSRFFSLRGDIARLERAISNFFLEEARENGFEEVSTPLVVSRSALTNTGQLPKFEEDLFKIDPKSHTCNGEEAFLIPTAEVPLTNLHADEILEEKDLPIKYCALTQCFRAEAGSYGRDTRGLIRTHQFGKVELVVIATPEASAEEHERLTSNAESLLTKLRLPHRRVILCSGDTGFGASICYDIEVWCPGAGEFREISSCSNTRDFQSRRMGLRYYKTPSANKEGKKKKEKPVLAHTINGSGLAIGRTLVAVLENYQQEDGSVVVPEILRKFMGGQEVLRRSKFVK